MIKINKQLYNEVLNTINQIGLSNIEYDQLVSFKQSMFDKIKTSKDWNAYLSAIHDFKQRLQLNIVASKAKGEEEETHCINNEYIVAILQLYYDAVLNHREYMQS